LAKLDKSKTRIVEFERPMSLFEVPWAAETRMGYPALDVSGWFELHAPQAYYLATTLPPLVSRHAR